MRCPQCCVAMIGRCRGSLPPHPGARSAASAIVRETARSGPGPEISRTHPDCRVPDADDRPGRGPKCAHACTRRSSRIASRYRSSAAIAAAKFPRHDSARASSIRASGRDPACIDIFAIRDDGLVGGASPCIHTRKGERQIDLGRMRLLESSIAVCRGRVLARPGRERRVSPHEAIGPGIQGQCPFNGAKSCECMALGRIGLGQTGERCRVRRRRCRRPFERRRWPAPVAQLCLDFGDPRPERGVAWILAAPARDKSSAPRSSATRPSASGRQLAASTAKDQPRASASTG